jgi:Domain of unknown function (DUF4279)
VDRKNECYAYFSLVGEFDPADVTSRLAVTPTQSWQKGELTDRGWERNHSRWSLFSRLPRDRAIEDHIRDVLLQLEEHADAFITISDQYQGGMQTVGYFYADYPGVFFERDIIDGLHKFRLSIDFDYYGLYSRRLNDTGQ